MHWQRRASCCESRRVECRVCPVADLIASRATCPLRMDDHSCWGIAALTCSRQCHRALLSLRLDGIVLALVGGEFLFGLCDDLFLVCHFWVHRGIWNQPDTTLAFESFKTLFPGPRPVFSWFPPTLSLELHRDEEFGLLSSGSTAVKFHDATVVCAGRIWRIRDALAYLQQGK